MPHLFFDIHHLSLQERISIINAAVKVNTKLRIDKLDCSISYSRVSSDMTFTEIMELFDMESHFVVIHRNDISEYGEVGFRTSSYGIDHFLWIYTSVDDLYKIVNKYKLEKAT